MKTPGLKPGDGWDAKQLPNGSVSVTYSFLEAEILAVAEWNAILESKEVRYINLYAKYMSWIPEY